MRQLNGVYTRRFNDSHGRCGHVFQGRCKAIIVQRETDLKELARDIVLNPVRAGMLDRPQDWPWSSYSATTADAACADWLRRDWLLSAFGSAEEATVAHYRRFVAEGSGVAGPWPAFKGQIYLGSEQFVERMQGLIDPKRALREVPKRQRRSMAKPLGAYAARYTDRDRAMAEAYRTGACSMQAIAERFRHYYEIRDARLLPRLLG